MWSFTHVNRTTPGSAATATSNGPPSPGNKDVVLPSAGECDEELVVEGPRILLLIGVADVGCGQCGPATIRVIRNECRDLVLEEDALKLGHHLVDDRLGDLGEQTCGHKSRPEPSLGFQVQRGEFPQVLVGQHSLAVTVADAAVLEDQLRIGLLDGFDTLLVRCYFGCQRFRNVRY